jgi:hypothetical protein
MYYKVFIYLYTNIYLLYGFISDIYKCTLLSSHFVLIHNVTKKIIILVEKFFLNIRCSLSSDKKPVSFFLSLAGFDLQTIFELITLRRSWFNRLYSSGEILLPILF